MSTIVIQTNSISVGMSIVGREPWVCLPDSIAHFQNNISIRELRHFDSIN